MRRAFIPRPSSSPLRITTSFARQVVVGAVAVFHIDTPSTGRLPLVLEAGGHLGQLGERAGGMGISAAF
jgi:hypothetical protein